MTLAAVLAASVTMSDAPQLSGALVLPRQPVDACARVMPPMEDTVSRIVRALCGREQLHPDRSMELKGR